MSGRRWATSDQHFGHAAIIRHCNRPFRDVEEMGEVLVDRWNLWVGPTDTVYIVGDLSLSLPMAERYAPRLAGRKRLVPGNHDLCHPSRGKIATAVRRYEAAGIAVLAPTVVVPIGGQLMRLCHFPPAGADVQRHGDTYAAFRPWRDLPIVHGHTHSAVRSAPGLVHVGVDAWNFTPVSFEEIAELAA
jgi:calcineurin-like phosphoesterase family protein